MKLFFTQFGSGLWRYLTQHYFHSHQMTYTKICQEHVHIMAILYTIYVYQDSMQLHYNLFKTVKVVCSEKQITCSH